jgi:porin
MMRLLLLLALLLLATPALAQPAPDLPSAQLGTQPTAATPPAPDTSPPGFWDRDTMLGDLGGVRTRLQDFGIKFGLEEQEELWGTLSGGLATGAGYDGVTTMSVTLDLEKMAGWSGASIFANAYQIHGLGPEGNVGALQLLSDLEATPATRLYDLWIDQKLFGGVVDVRVGQEGINDEFMLSTGAAVMLNSSFGFPAWAALDLPSGAPNYPLSAPFVRVNVTPNESWTAMLAVFDGNPAGPGTNNPQQRNASGTLFRVSDPALVVGEAWYGINQEPDARGLPGRYKVGFLYHYGRFYDQYDDIYSVPLASPLSNGLPKLRQHDDALYGVLDQMLWRTGKDTGISVFGQIMGGPGDRNLVNVSAFGGAVWKGAVPGREADTLGVGFAYVHIGSAATNFANLQSFYGTGAPSQGSETVLEATYQAQVTGWLQVQPDVQYVVNPGAGFTLVNNVRTKLPNATVVGVRGTLTF